MEKTIEQQRAELRALAGKSVREFQNMLDERDKRIAELEADKARQLTPEQAVYVYDDLFGFRGKNAVPSLDFLEGLANTLKQIAAQNHSSDK